VRLQEICDELEERIEAVGSAIVESETAELCGFGIFMFREGYETPAIEERSLEQAEVFKS
jgi:nucleoid DNA-binding protein